MTATLSEACNIHQLSIRPITQNESIKGSQKDKKCFGCLELCRYDPPAESLTTAVSPLCLLPYLNVAQDPCRVHPTGFVDRVAPDVKHRFGGPNDPTDQGSGRHAYPQHEVVEGVFIDVVQLVVQFRREIYQVTEVIVGIVLRISRFVREA